MRVIVTESWLLVSGLLIFAGLLASSTTLVALGILILGTGGAARLWARLSLEEVVYSRTLSARRVFVGEQIELELVIENRKVVPVPWVEVREALPRDIPIVGAKTLPSGIATVAYLLRTTGMSSNDRIEWPLTLLATRRGYFRVGPTRLRSGDLFGFFDSEREVTRQDAIVVYPHTYSMPELGLDSARPFGEQRGGNRLFEDPSRVVGVRDYLPGDPMKRIDWNATARVGRMQSRLYEPSRTQAIVVALNIQTYEQVWQGSDPVLLERGVTVAASIARWAFEAGSALGLRANGSFPDADRPIRIGAGSRPDQLLRVLEALAMVTSFATGRLSTELESRDQPLPNGATIVVIAAIMSERLVATMHRLRAEGHFVHVVKTTPLEWDIELGSLPVSDVSAYMADLEEQAAAAEAAIDTSGAAREAIG